MTRGKHPDRRWTLKQNAMNVQVLAAQGDSQSLADMRAYIDSLRKNRNRNRWLKGLAKPRNKTMKNRIKLLSIASICITALTGCKQITPRVASTLTTTAVYAFGRNNPKIVATMRQVQPAACFAASQPGSTVEDVVGVIENTAGVDPDTKAVINVILTVYQVATVNKGTNNAALHPYLEAVVCPGWAGGLALLPTGLETKNAIPLTVSGKPLKGWVLVK